MCNIEGEILLCGDLSALLGLEPDNPTGAASGDGHLRSMVMLSDDHGRWVVEVERVHGVIHVDRADCIAAPATVENALDRYTECLAPLQNEEFAALLDAGRLAQGFKAALP
jgi:chemotaxis signal transduction protein